MTVILLLVLSLLLCGYGQGTEQFIPIGQSPGVSGKLSFVGEIVDRTSNVIVVCCNDDGSVRAYGRKPGFVIYLDKSLLKQQNIIGSWKDLQKGKVIEVYPDRWIKVRVER